MEIADIQKQQSEVWNGPMGETWVEQQALTDQMLAPTLGHLIEAVQASSALHVLDIGCGNGATAVAMADAQDAGGTVVGIDLSRPMIANATERWASHQERVSFIAADAGAHDFGEARFDHFSSRFGTMFFADQIAAFSHLRRFATDGASMFLITWRGAEENAFLTTGPRVVASILGPPPPADPNAPSPFAMSDPERVKATMHKSGWTNVALEPLDLAFGFPASNLDVFMTKLAPLGPGVADADPATQAKIFDLVRAQYTQFISGDRLTYDAACWAITARAA